MLEHAGTHVGHAWLCVCVYVYINVNANAHRYLYVYYIGKGISNLMTLLVGPRGGMVLKVQRTAPVGFSVRPRIKWSKRGIIRSLLCGSLDFFKPDHSSEAVTSAPNLTEAGRAREWEVTPLPGQRLHRVSWFFLVVLFESIWIHINPFDWLWHFQFTTRNNWKWDGLFQWLGFI